MDVWSPRAARLAFRVGGRLTGAAVAESAAIPLALVFLMLAAAVEAAESDKNEGTNYVDSPVAKACIAIGPPDSATPLRTGAYQGMAHAIRGPIRHNTYLGIGKASLAPLAKPSDVDQEVMEVVERMIERVQQVVGDTPIGRGVKRLRQAAITEYYRHAQRFRRHWDNVGDVLHDEMQRVPIRIRHAVQDFLDEQMHHHLHGHHQMLDI